MRKSKLKKAQEVIEKSQVVFATCEWIEKEGMQAIDLLDQIEQKPWSIENEKLKEEALNKLKFIIAKSQIEFQYMDDLEKEIEILNKKNKKV
jgi:hypothetical protein